MSLDQPREIEPDIGTPVEGGAATPIVPPPEDRRQEAPPEACRQEPVHHRQDAVTEDPGSVMARILEHSIEVPTDTDQSIYLVDLNASRLRFVQGIGWLAWDGKRWADGALDALQWAKEAARRRTSTVLGKNCPGLIKPTLALENRSHLVGAMTAAEADPRVRLPLLALDADPWLLNCTNGIVDLRSGELLPHDSHRFMTKLAPVDYVRDVRHPALDRILAALEAQTPGMCDFLQRLFGMCLTGDATAEVLILIQGEGGAGKTTLSEAFLNMIGDYGVKLPFETLCLSQRGRQSGAAQPELARLRGARFACASEGDEAARLDAGVVKSLTGNERISARGLHKDPIEFPQTWKLMMVSNYEPNCSGDDSGLWRRIIKVPFRVVPEDQRDPHLKKALTLDPEARRALLAWAVRGSMAWHADGCGRRGLRIPAIIDTMTAEYRQRQDVLGQWWEDSLGLSLWRDPEGYMPVTELRRLYEAWTDGQGMPKVMARRWNAFLEKHGLVRVTHRLNGQAMKCWRGISTQRPLLPDAGQGALPPRPSDPS